MEAAVLVPPAQVLRGSILLTWISGFRLQRKLTSLGAHWPVAQQIPVELGRGRFDSSEARTEVGTVGSTSPATSPAHWSPYLLMTLYPAGIFLVDRVEDLQQALSRGPLPPFESW